MTKNNFFRILLVVFMAVACAGVISCRETETSGTLRVLTTDFAPFFHPDETGRPTGLEHKILASFAEARGLQLEVVWVEDFSDIIDALLRGDGDVIASTLTITEERSQTVDFSVPYFSTRVVLVQRQGSILTDVESLAGKKALTIEGTTYEEILRGIPGLELVYVATEEEMYASLAAGNADAFASDSANFLWLGKDYPDLELAMALSDREFYGMALRKTDPLKPELDAHIQELIETEVFWRFVEESYGEIVADSIGDLKRDFFADGQ